MSSAVNGRVRIHYEVEGNGMPLVLQHGFSQSLGDWYQAGYVDALKFDYQLILVDARGHGESDKLYNGTSYGLSSFVGDVVAVLDALGIERAHYWGYSMGGWIGFGMAKEARARLRGLIIGGQHAYGRAPPAGLPDGNDAHAFLTAFFKRMGLNFDSLPAGDRTRWLANDTRALAATLQARPSLEGMLATMVMPCLLYAGGADGVFEQAKKSARAIRNCAFVALPRLTHGAAFDKAELIVPRVASFLRDTDAHSLQNREWSAP
jgi:pimeloyl-ACP methyl ester carboxylesterase